MKKIDTDILVIGSGLAGLFFSLKCASKGARVLIATKRDTDITATALAQGGIAASMGHPDSIRSHIEDTLRTGKGLSNRKIVDFVVKNAPRAIEELDKLGVRFDRGKEGNLELGREGGHSFRRIVHVKDKTGLAIETALIDQVKKDPRIEIMENAYATHLDIQKKGNKKFAGGAYFYKQKESGKKGNIFYCSAKITVLATGGLCALYKHTVNPGVATGDGIAMAYHAGCILQDLEFIQFHPTALQKGSSPFFLISEAVRGEGAFLVTREGIPIMMGYERKDLEARDVVSRRIFEIMKEEPVFLTLPRKNKSWIKQRFSGIYKECRKWGVDICREYIPIIPAAHYACGGIKTNIYGETNINGLMAIGEVASTGLHGANRLASNSLLESVVISRNAALKTLAFLKKIKKSNKEKDEKDIPVYKLSVRKRELKEIENELKKILWEKAGIIRSVKGLKEGLYQISKLEKKMSRFKKKGFNIHVHRLSNQIVISKIIMGSALLRKESRGCHYTEEYPHPSPHARHTCIKKHTK